MFVKEPESLFSLEKAVLKPLAAPLALPTAASLAPASRKVPSSVAMAPFNSFADKVPAALVNAVCKISNESANLSPT